MEEIKVVHSNISGIDANLAIEVNNFEFQVYWKPSEMGEVCCLSKIDSLTETELKNLIVAFKEAKSKLTAKMEFLNTLIYQVMEELKEYKETNDNS